MKQVQKNVGKQQAVIIMNGRAGVGKDSLMDFARDYYTVRNISSVLRVKEYALAMGWDGEYDNRGRQFLADIKMALVKYDPMVITSWLFDEYRKFKSVEQDVMFIHIREADEIDKFKSLVPHAKAILVTRKTGLDVAVDTSESTLNSYRWDYVFANDEALDVTGKKFVELIDKIRKTGAELPLLAGK